MAPLFPGKAQKKRASHGSVRPAPGLLSLRSMRMRTRIVATILLVGTFTGVVFAQGGNGTLTGTVEDASKAVIPGVSITALNTNTGVVTTTVSNETGSFNIPALIPGVYRLTASLPGFQTQIFNNIELGT